MTGELPNPWREAVLSMVRESVQALPPGTATLAIRDHDGLTEVTITPTRSSAAPFSVAVEGESITVALGQGTTVELFGKMTAVADDVRTLFRCAVDGTIHERVWRRAGRIIRCVSRIVVDGKESRFGSADVLDIAPRSRLEIIDHAYDPYV